MEFRLRRLVVSILLLGVVGLVILLNGGPSTSPGPDRPAERSPGVAPDGPATVESGETGGGILEGRVERRGRGVAARIEARIADRIDRPPVLRTADAGADGGFRIEGLPPGRYELRAVTGDRAVGETVAEIPVAGARVRVRIEIPAGEHTLSARAVWSNGAPFLGLVRRDAWTHTDSDGRFRIRGLGPGTHPLVFLLPGQFRSSGHEVVVPTQRERVFVVDEGAVAVRGRVVDAADESPVANALVTAGGGDALIGTSMSQRVRTDREGRFRVRVASKHCSFRVVADGYRSMWFFPDPEAAEEAVVCLDRTLTVTGRVETESGDPVSGVPVFAVEEGAWVRTPTARAVSGEDGRFVMEGVSAEDVLIYARGGGWVSHDLAAALTGWYASLPRTLGTGDDADVILVVVEASRIEGTVTDGEGRPVVGALVRGVPWFEGGIPDSYTFRESIRTEVATDTEGRFRILDAVPGLQHDLTVTAPGFLPEKARTSAPPVGGAVGATIVLSSGRDLRVHAVWAGTEKPVVGATVEASAKDPHFEIVANGTTDEDGRVTVGPLPSTGPIGVTGRHPSGARPPPGAGFPNGPPAEEVRLTFHRGLVLAGRVVFPDGTPAPHGRLRVWSPADRHYAPIAAGGRFRLSDLPPGRFRVDADAARDGVRFAKTIGAEMGDEEVEIVLAPAEEREDDDRILTVRVLDPEGRPVARAETTYVVLTGRENEPGRGWIQVYGGVAKLDFGPDSLRYWLAVYDARSFSGARLPLGRVLLGPLTKFEGELIVRLPPEKTIRGIVVDESGRGIPGANVGYKGIADAGTSMHIRMDRPVFADGSGRFRIGGLGDGDYIVHSGSADLLGAREIVKAGATDVVLVLRRPISVRVRVVDATGAGVKGRGVEVKGNWFGGPKGVTNEEGVVVLGDISPGSRYSLHVNATPPVIIDPWIPKDTTIRLPKSLGVAGRVVDVRGEPVPKVEVWCRPDGMDWLDTTADREGRFSFTGLPPGKVTLIAEAEDLEPVTSDSRAVRVRAGKRDVRLVRRAGVTMRLRIAEWPADMRRGVDANLIAASGEIVASESIEEDGTVEFLGLDAKSTYSLWIEALDDGRTAWRQGLRPGPDPIPIGLETGGLIRGTLTRRGPVEVDGLRLVAPGIEMDATLFADGRFEIAGVPTGSFEIIAEGWIDDRRVRTVVPARRGETVELVIGE